MTTTTEQSAPRVLVIGSTGRIGAAVAAALDHAPERVTPVRTSRNPETVAMWVKEGMQAVYLDLDDPDTFALALTGIDRVFLVAGTPPR